MGKYILSLLLLVSCTSTKPTTQQFACDFLNYEIRDFKFDVFGNLYTIDLKNRLKVYDNNLNFLFEYYNNILGEITHIDVTNPKKIILFFRDFQKVIFVDDTLAELGRYDGSSTLIAIGSSRDNNLWIYDSVDYRLKKISTSGKVILESNPLETYHQLDISPDYIIEYNNMVYMVEEGAGIAVLDNFGNFSKYLAMNGVYSVTFKDQAMNYLQNGVRYKHLIESIQGPQKIAAISVAAHTAYISEKFIYYLDGNCLIKQEIKL